ncbi:TadE/TadG family type IV pilus assembly protein [Methylobacterium gossipiicola]|uniref:Flp pilus assembly protein TadG n=1 Tax=Methylobacterium gossipiicola TaxID=582675 RepID=A0A1I2RZG2_9HYPH|nr:TadE/TadG family type IV pilus assembly protein [Methylobacterium gossipiicola]SFG44929.1 Flp pilus assembly protein TadG [Methylobacterium gossipiicola]
MIRVLRTVRRAQRRWNGDAAGVAAIEFSLILPIVLVLLVGCIEIVNAIENWRRVLIVVRTAADLASQGDAQNPVADSVMNDILSATTLAIAPYDIAKMTITISALGVGVNTASLLNPYVCSSWSFGAQPRGVGPASDLTVPPNYQRIGARYVLAEVSMPYTLVLGTVFSKIVKDFELPVTWRESLAWPVRGGVAYSALSDSEVVFQKRGGSNPAPCPQS